MKRKTANSTIDEFFATALKKAPPLTTDSLSSLKNKIVIVKKSSDKKVLQICIPSLQQKEKEFDDEFYEKKFTDISNSLIEGIEIIFSGNFDQVNFTKLHNDVECYCRFKNSKNLFDNFIMPKLSVVIDSFIEELSKPDLDIYAMSNMIESFEDSLSNLRKIILYLDRTYIFSHRINGFKSISDIVHNRIRKIFLGQISNFDPSESSFKSKPTLNMIISQVKLQINLFRCSFDKMDDEDFSKSHFSNGHILEEQDDGSSKAHVSYHSYKDDSNSSEIDEGMKALSVVLKFIDELGLYESNVEEELIKQTYEFYSTFSHDLCLIEFIDRLSFSKEKEYLLLEAGVKESTINSFLQSINKTALVDNQQQLFGSEFQEAIDIRNDDIIQKLFSFFDSPELRPIFTSKLGQYFTSIADNILKEGTTTSEPQPQQPTPSTGGRTIAEADKSSIATNSPSECIERLIKLYNYALEYVSEVFPQNSAVLQDVKSEFDHNFSQKSEILAQYLAKHFAKGLPIKKEEIEFFNMIHAKGFFEVSYFALTKNRILNWDHSFDADREKELVSRLKEISGLDFVQRLQILIEDFESSQEIQQSIQGELDKSLKFRAAALKWQNTSNELFNDSVKYPPNIQNSMDLFNHAFIGKKESEFSKPQLHWSSKLTTVVGTIGNSKCQMTGDQALILLALQDRNILSKDEIYEITGINMDTISDNLTVLQKEEAGSIVKAIDEKNFCMNPDSIFNLSTLPDAKILKKKGKIVIFPSTYAAQKEKESDESDRENARHNRIMCSIMRKMKVFKILSLTELFAKVKRDIGFEPNQKIFSDIVSNLVKNLFLERVNDKQLRYVDTIK